MKKIIGWVLKLFKKILMIDYIDTILLIILIILVIVTILSLKKNNNLLYAIPYQHYTNAIEGYFNVLKSRLQKKKGLTYDELVNNVKDVLDEIPIHIYKNLIKGAYDRSEKYVKRPSTRKRKPKKYLD